MTHQTWSKSPQKLVDTFYEAMKAFPEAELRKMFSYPCAFFNGNMFIGLHQNNLAIRLSATDRQYALEKGLGIIFAPMNGRVMKEYVALSEHVIYDPHELQRFLSISFQYVQKLPPKVKHSR